MKKYTITILLTSLFFLTCLQIFGANHWGKRASVLGSKRERGVGFAIGNRGYIGLGQDTLNLMLNDFWEYDPGTNSWTQKANFPGAARRDAAAFAIGTKGYVGTGMNNADAFMGFPQTDFWEYNPVTNLWAAKAAFPGGFGSGVYYSTGFAVSGKGYLCGGKVGASSYSNELWEYTPASNSWLQKAFYPNGVRYGGTAFVIGNIAYFGTGTDENVFTNDFCKYNPATDTWTPLSPFPGSGRFSSCTFTLNGHGFMVFGSDGGYKDELWEYDPIADYWYSKAVCPGGARRSSVAFTINYRAFAGTGKGLTGTRKDFWEYIPSVPVGINEHLNSISSIYPNPMIDQSTIVLSEELMNSYEVLNWQLVNIQGKLIQENKIDHSTFTIEKNGMSPGTYFINLIASGERIATKKISVL